MLMWHFMEVTKVNQEEELTLAEASRESGVCAQTLRKYVSLGHLKARLRPNRRWMIRRSDLLLFLGWYQGRDV